MCCCTATWLQHMLTEQAVTGAVEFPSNFAISSSPALPILHPAGYVSWGFRNPSTTKEKLMKTAAQNTVFALGKLPTIQQHRTPLLW